MANSLKISLGALAVLGVVFYLIYGSTPETEINQDSSVQEPRIILTTELPYVSEAELAEVRQEVQAALHSVLPVLGIKNRRRTEIKIVDTGICNAAEGVVTLPISHIRDKSAAIIHEITHIVAKHGDNSFFSEGLAVYFQNRFGLITGFPNYSVSLTDLVRSFQGQLRYIPDLMRDNQIFSQVGTVERRIAYIEAGSFISFLVARYGEDKLAELHNSYSLQYDRIYGRDVGELEAEWKRYVLGES